MFASDRKSFSAMVESIRSVNADIDMLLSGNGAMTTEQVDLLNSHVQQRGEFLETLQTGTKVLESTGDTGVKDQVAAFWNAFCVELKTADTMRMERMSSKLKESADAVRMTRKRLSLLQYQ
jgi:nanoRNase/pAp phosphatase (c-di-AMP/oligoRNAs hydrolase)